MGGIGSGRKATKAPTGDKRRQKALWNARDALRLALREGARVSVIREIVAEAFEAEGYYMAAQAERLSAEASAS